MHSVTEIRSILRTLAGAPDEPAALATLISVEGSSYRRPGARLIALADGTRAGSISGGCLEEDVLERARAVLRSGRPEVAVYDTSEENDIIWGAGVGCRGVARIFIERVAARRPDWVAALSRNLGARAATRLSVVHGGVEAGLQGTYLAAEMAPLPRSAAAFQDVIAPPPQLVLFGAGDDARPLARIAKEVGWCVTVVDSRAAFASRARFPDADHVVVAAPDRLQGKLDLDPGTFTVLMTHRYAEDSKLLRILLAQPLAYVGVLGPRKRTEKLVEQLRAEGFTPDPAALERMCAPVGLDLGATTPETIALAILAEIQCWLTGRTPIHLRDRASPIHG